MRAALHFGIEQDRRLGDRPGAFWVSEGTAFSKRELSCLAVATVARRYKTELVRLYLVPEVQLLLVCLFMLG